MKAILIVFFLFVAYLNASNIDKCLGYSLEKELETINNTCITVEDRQIMTGNVLNVMLSATLYMFAAPAVQETIGLSEMRKAFGFEKMGAWTNFRKPSEKEIKNAKNIEEYYELMEPRDLMRSLDSFTLLEKNVTPNIGSFDKNLPSIRTIYRCEFAEIMKRVGKINRKTVDKMIEKWTEISPKITTAVRNFNSDCYWRQLQKQREFEKQLE